MKLTEQDIRKALGLPEPKKAKKAAQSRPYKGPTIVVVLNVRRPNSWPPERKLYRMPTIFETQAIVAAHQQARAEGYIVHAHLDTYIED
ncbi:hypothetical protein [Pseudomonas phage BHU-1]|nr:hypothetical protein [Pseudomonas phage BHU-1]UGV19959.1 hypothetical protein [Pseudomonas phage Pa BHU-15]UIW13601.1 hypothetical protein [Pseudomonas phage Pa BHU-17]